VALTVEADPVAQPPNGTVRDFFLDQKKR